ncbi:MULTISPECIES: FAD-dependent oxidoreductase [Streptomyces]|uniref:FAD-dependent oxidoreductase n=1 Tax=Streptomyces TaxID=1883 RepID=UPI00163BEB2A|nr:MULTISPECIES: FAD-dependent monooxygenase [Streptomyces]MBC2877766.1 FAD-dependent monooxygenase [Streptomyces sp. TYQ1024]UBI38668.1 FAD-dependent monooxygenase [Streptomyces mobaraensis]UKW31250.1 FAD-dependent monooxygenase [Streptomyces sp. TYQ1024]
MHKARTALVIGGGIAGPVTALALAEAGIRATVHEARPAPADGIGATLTIAPNGLEALRTIGAHRAVEAVGHPVPSVALEDGRGGRLSRFDGFAGLPPTLAMRRADLFRALSDHAVARGVPVVHGSRLVGAERTPRGVTAFFADGGTAEADVLIGADGIRSTVRSLIDPGAPGPEYGGVLGFGGVVDEEPNAPVEPGVMHFGFGRVFLGHWRLPDGRVCWFAALPRTEPLTTAEVARVPAADWLARLRALYAGHVPGEALISRTRPEDLMATGPMERMPSVPHWHRGPMVLVGDAVHAPSSSSGQGASLAIESALELARCLRDLPVPDAFAAYERLRRPRVEAVGRAAATTNRAKAGTGGSPGAGSFTLPDPEQMFGHLHRFRVDWEAEVRA